MIGVLHALVRNGASLFIFVRFCVFWRVSVRQDGLQKSAHLHRVVQKCAQFEAFLCNTPFSFAPFCVSPNTTTRPNGRRDSPEDLVESALHRESHNLLLSFKEDILKELLVIFVIF